MQLIKRTVLIIGFCVTIVLPASSFADKDVRELEGGYGTSQTAQTSLTAPPADQLITPANLVQGLYFNPNPPNSSNPGFIAQTQTEQSLAGFFSVNPNSNTSDALTTNIVNNAATFGSSTQIPSTASLYANCSTSIITGGSAGLRSCLQQQQGPLFTNVDVNSLLTPIVFQQTQQQAATNFINAVASLNQAVPILDLNKFAKDRNSDIPTVLANNVQIINYINDIRTFAAMQGVGIGVLQQLYAERVPNSVSQKSDPNLYNALTSLGLQGASSLQIEQYVATRRILNSSSWMTNLLSDTPAALLREINVLLAENLAEQYKNRLAIERLTAVMAALELQQTNQNMREKITQDISGLGLAT